MAHIQQLLDSDILQHVYSHTNGVSFQLLYITFLDSTTSRFATYFLPVFNFLVYFLDLGSTISTPKMFINIHNHFWLSSCLDVSIAIWPSKELFLWMGLIFQLLVSHQRVAFFFGKAKIHGFLGPAKL